MGIALLFLVFALVLFILAALNIPNTGRPNLIAAGLACSVAAQLVGTLN